MGPLTLHFNEPDTARTVHSRPTRVVRLKSSHRTLGQKKVRRHRSHHHHRSVDPTRDSQVSSPLYPMWESPRPLWGWDGGPTVGCPSFTKTSVSLPRN